jgi:hypothetical protein
MTFPIALCLKPYLLVKVCLTLALHTSLLGCLCWSHRTTFLIWHEEVTALATADPAFLIWRHNCVRRSSLLPGMLCPQIFTWLIVFSFSLLSAGITE